MTVQVFLLKSISRVDVVGKTELLTQQMVFPPDAGLAGPPHEVHLLSEKVGALVFCAVDVPNENVAGEIRSAYLFSADVPNEKHMTESSQFRNEIAASTNRDHFFFFFSFLTINRAALHYTLLIAFYAAEQFATITS